MTTPDPDSTVRPVEYKGEPLDAERGPGLGCFRFQLVVLAIAIVLTPLSVAWNWPSAVSAGLLFLTIFLLLFAGQTIIFLLRLVAADRRDGRRRPLASGTPTVGELEDQVAEPHEPPTVGEPEISARVRTLPDEARIDEDAAVEDAANGDGPAASGVRE